MIVCPGQRRPDNMGVKTYLQFSIFCHGTWLTQEPPCRLQQFAFFHLSSFNQFTALRSFLIGELQSISERCSLQSFQGARGSVYLCFCMDDTFQITNSNGFSIQVCVILAQGHSMTCAATAKTDISSFSLGQWETGNCGFKPRTGLVDMCGWLILQIYLTPPWLEHHSM